MVITLYAIDEMTRRKKNINKLIPCACGVCGLTLWKYNKWGKKRTYIKGHSFFGKKHTEETIKKQSEVKKGKIRDDIRGEKNPMWKGKDIGYGGLHNWIRTYFPKPQKCHMCMKAEPKEVANITGILSRDFKNWAWFCFKCHKLFDNIYERNLREYNERYLDKK